MLATSNLQYNEQQYIDQQLHIINAQEIVMANHYNSLIEDMAEFEEFTVKFCKRIIIKL